MTIAHAKQFLRRAMAEPELVDHFTNAPDKQAIRTLLETIGLRFNVLDFDEAYQGRRFVSPCDQ